MTVPSNLPTTYTINRRAGVCWITSEQAHIRPMWSHHADPLAAVVVMIARAVDLDGNDITDHIATTLRDALTAATGSATGGAS